MIEPETLDRWRTRSYRSAILKLASLLELRVIIEDAKVEGERVIMEMYKQAADAMMVHPDTVRNDIATIRNYSPENLAYWIKNGVGFSHIDMANVLQHKAKKPALQLLNECIALGNENGKTMTVNELIVFALGEKKQEPVLYRVTAMFERMGKFPTLLGWGMEKITKYNTWLDAGREFFI